MEYTEIEKKLEGILFAMGDSVSVDELSMALDLPLEEITEALEKMQKKLEEEERGIRLVRFDDSYQLCTAKSVYEYLIKIAKQPKKYAMTDVLLETLSIIAYKQPVTKAEIEKIRGVNSDHAVNRLVEFNLCEEVGRLDAPGRPMLFATTEEFLRSFGITSLSDLPTLEQDELERMRLESYEEVDAKLKLSDS